jgi:alpha-beta hydrolase superfamily lysophospholipase
MKNRNKLFTTLAVAAISFVFISFMSCKNDTEDVKLDDQTEAKDTIAWTLEQVFKSGDSLDVRADLYMKHDRNAPFIVLFHQAGWSRGEYLEIAPKLNALGFNCMAVDQRSGGTINGVENITAKNARDTGVGTDFPDAVQDMLASIEYAKENFSDGELIIWGSSYSAALVLKIFGDDENLADKALSFSPGEYFERFGKPSNWIGESAMKINKPVFITSTKSEKNVWWDIYQNIPAKDKAHFLPTTVGNHGSRALWNEFSDSKEYWAAVEEFLK